MSSTTEKGRATGAGEQQPETQQALNAALDLCVRKTRQHIKRLADQPKAASNDPEGDYFNWQEGFFEIGNWTSSFLTGMAVIAWSETKDDYFREQLERLAPVYREKVFEQHMDTMHDLGFLYTLYSVALHKLTGDKSHREVGLRAADLLAGRYYENGGYIRAWGRMDEHGTDYDGLAIIDCLMNLPLLFWAAEETGDDKYREIAIKHADTTLKHFIREDDSVCHAYRFDPQTGAVVGEANYCGYGVGSHWARGTTWGVYGFALMYRYTQDRKYLDASLRLARKFIANLDEEVVPVWDFKLPAGETGVRDSSAAAVAVCGFQELEQLGAADEEISATKRALLARLCGEDYLDTDEARPGVLKHGQVGPGDAAYTSWGDYYLMEALDRELFKGETFW